MQAQHVPRLSELQYTILSEIPDAVLITDTDQHVVYWNGVAESLYGLEAEQTLGRRLDVCCPDLWASVTASGEEFLKGLTSPEGRWCGEIDCHNHQGQTVALQCRVSVLRRRRNAPTGLLWILRDLTQQRRLEHQLRACLELLRGTPPPGQQGFDLEEADAPAIQSTRGTPPVSNGKPPEVVLWAEDSDDDAVLLSRAWQKAEVNDRLIRVRDGADVIRYLSGEGVYADRSRFPLPSLVLLDIKMPGTNGLDVINWMKREGRFPAVPIVILTSSAASGDISEAARLGVKGYLVKPADPSEWVVKVKTVTSQCR